MIAYVIAVNKMYAPLMKEVAKVVSGGRREGIKLRDTSESRFYPSFVVSISCPADDYVLHHEMGKVSIEFTGLSR